MHGIKRPRSIGFGVLIVLMGVQAWLVHSPHTADFFSRAALLELSLVPILLAIWIAIRATRSTQTYIRALQAEAKRSEQAATRLKWHATHDSLTRLINRHEFKERVQRLCQQTTLDGSVHALMVLDLDQFKTVNDSCGHHAGDMLLRQLAQYLKKNLRASDTLARIGGDEFGALLPMASTQEAQRVAQVIRQEVNEFRFYWRGQIFEIGVSIGIASINREQNNYHEILNTADRACYLAKDAGRNQIRALNACSKLVEQSRSDAHCLQELPRAIRENRLELHAQEIRCVSDAVEKEPHRHYELLVRMRSLAGELVEPSRFIPVAESYGLAMEIDRWVVRSALQWLDENRCRGHHCPQSEASSTCEFSINLSGQSVSNPQFLREVLEMFDNSSVDPHQVTFEITETAVVSNLELAQDFILQLKSLGCRFSLDDFGSGMSSFGYLQDLDVDYVKIDGSLVKKVAKGGLENAMIDAIIHVARHKHARTVAEFVEDDLTINWLRSAGIDFIQGFIVHRPTPLTSLQPCVAANEEVTQLSFAM